MRETKAKSPEPLPLFDQVINEYPETGAAFSAMSQKAELLWHLDEYEEMCACYGKLREILKQQLYSEKVRLMFRTMDSRVGWYRVAQLSRELEQAVVGGKTVPAERWDRLRTLCETWGHNTDDPADRAESKVVVIESLYCQQRFEEALSVIEALLQASAKNEDDPGFRRPLAWARLFKGRALTKLGRYEESQGSIRQAIAAYENDPKGWDLGSPLPSAYYGLWQCLRAMKAPNDQIKAAVSPLLEKMPWSQHARRILNPKSE